MAEELIASSEAISAFFNFLINSSEEGSTWWHPPFPTTS